MSDKKEEKSKMTWRKAFQLNTRAMKLWWEKYPQLFAANILYRVINTATPYINIWFSARMIGDWREKEIRKGCFP